jgi:hypothetical protein
MMASLATNTHQKKFPTDVWYTNFNASYKSGTADIALYHHPTNWMSIGLLFI